MSPVGAAANLQPARPAAGPANVDGGVAAVEAAVRAIWARVGPQIIGRVSVLEEAVAALREGRLSDDLRAASIREAHKLAGTAGSFGFQHGSQLAREFERALLEPGVDGPDVSRLGDLVVMLRDNLQSRPAVAAEVHASDDVGSDKPLVLLVDDDAELFNGLRTAALARGLRLSAAATPAIARQYIARERPAVALVDFSVPSDPDEALTLLEDLAGRSPQIPALVLTAQQTLTDRVEVMRRGVRGFLPKTLSTSQVMDAVTDVLHRVRANDTTVLAVDDDPAILSLLKATLSPYGLRVVTLAEPLSFWDTLERCAPDLLILDMDMPDLGGLELCRVVRNDARLASLPVLFLTARTDPDTLTQAFQAGADDYVTKPIVGAELIARITNRLERTELYRRLAETDSLTGLATRRKGEQEAVRLLRLAERLQQPLLVAVLDVDHMKQINDRFGHAAGDEVLRRVGALLQGSFRGEDVVARWGGEEFLIAMYGLGKEDGKQRLTQVLKELGTQHFVGAEGESFSVTFSAGVAQHIDGVTDLPGLYRAADAALYQVKAAGRNAVR